VSADVHEAPRARGGASTSGSEAKVDQPGLGRLREAVGNPRGPSSGIARDVLAGLNTAIADVPDAMATALLVGVNPMLGLYGAMVGPVVGGLLASTRLMVITVTSAAALAAGQALASVSLEARVGALAAMVLLVGVFEIVLGVFGFGRLTRFVSYSVMTGLLIGIAVVIVLSQLQTVTGYSPASGSTLGRTAELLANLDRVHVPSLGVALLALVLAMTLPRTRLGGLGTLAAIAVPSALAVLLGLDGVALVRDVGEIPRGIPAVFLPSLSLITADVVTGALAVATILLVQSAGVSQSVSSQGGTPISVSRDFIAQGAANLASGLLRGLPVGGSLGATALNQLSGARTRLAPVTSGLWVAAIVLLVPRLVSYIAMPTLGALLISASLSTIQPREALSIWNTGWAPRGAAVATVLATLTLPIQAAVGIGIALTAVMYLSAASSDVSVVELVERPDGRIVEHRPRKQLASEAVTVLDVYGHLFFAGARTLERLLPRVGDARNPVLVLRLRGRSRVGATLVDVLSDYADRLRAVNGRLYLTGVGPEIHAQLVRSGKLGLTGPVRLYEATPVRGESTRAALADAESWLVKRADDERLDTAR
jgi:sulfate permease, SulP family